MWDQLLSRGGRYITDVFNQNLDAIGPALPKKEEMEMLSPSRLGLLKKSNIVSNKQMMYTDARKQENQVISESEAS